MRIVNAAMGELEVDPSRVVELPAGLIGLPDLTRFAVVELEEGNPFKWLQSMDQHDVGFIISEPTLFIPGYEVELRPEALATLGVDAIDRTVVFVIVSLGRSTEDITANLRGPVVVSLETRRGFQAALTDPRYPLRAPLPATWASAAVVEGEPCWS